MFPKIVDRDCVLERGDLLTCGSDSFPEDFPRSKTPVDFR